MGEFRGIDGLWGIVIHDSDGVGQRVFGGRETGGDGCVVDQKGRVDGVVVVVVLDCGTGVAFEIEQGAVEEFELSWGMVCSLGEA